MPRDRNDLKLSVGDRVLVPCVVVATGTGTRFVNVWLQTEEPLNPHSGMVSCIALNGRQVYRERKAGESGEDRQ